MPTTKDDNRSNYLGDGLWVTSEELHSIARFEAAISRADKDPEVAQRLAEIIERCNARGPKAAA